MTLMANLATLRDLGRAYCVHKYDSNWIAKICVDTSGQNTYFFFTTYSWHKYVNRVIIKIYICMCHKRLWI